MQSKDLRSFVQFSSERVRRDTVYETEHLWAQVLCFERNQSYGPASDPRADAIVQVMAGEGVVLVGGKRKRVKQWDSVLVPAGSELAVSNASGEPLVLFLITAPPPVPTAATEGNGQAT